MQSHQDLAAAHRIAVFDQWHLDHGMAGLLSERMRQKDEKRAAKLALQQARLSSTPGSTITKTGSKMARKASLTSSISSSEIAPLVIKRSNSDDDFRTSIYTTPRYVRAAVFSPTTNDHRHSSYPAISTPLQVASKGEDPVSDILPALSGEDVSPIKSSPGALQLKGEVLPGMDLFDAAPEEQRRKRNQKKDVSVLKKLEHYASIVDPTEVVHAAMDLNRVLKRRAMEDLENDSPVEGEEPVPTPLRKRGSAPRVQRIKKEPKYEKATKPKKRGRPRKLLQTPTKGNSSVVGDEPGTSSRFSATEDEGRQLKLTFRNIDTRKKTSKFSVYEDPTSAFGIDGASEHVPGYVDAEIASVRVPYSAPTWQTRPNESYDPFKLTRPRLPPSGFGTLDVEKENVNPLILATNDADVYKNINPLLMHGGGHKEIPQAQSMSSRLNAALASRDTTPQVPRATQRVFEDPSDLFVEQDAFLPVRNPLMAALSNLASPAKQTTFGFGSFSNAFSPQYRQPLFAP